MEYKTMIPFRYFGEYKLIRSVKVDPYSVSLIKTTDWCLVIHSYGDRLYQSDLKPYWNRVREHNQSALWELHPQDSVTNHMKWFDQIVEDVKTHLMIQHL